MVDLLSDVQENHYDSIALLYVDITNFGMRVVIACPTHLASRKVKEAIRSLLITRRMLIEGKTAMTFTENVLVGEQISVFADSLDVDLVLDAGISEGGDDSEENSEEETELRIYLSVGMEGNFL